MRVSNRLDPDQDRQRFAMVISQDDKNQELILKAPSKIFIFFLHMASKIIELIKVNKEL